jgi:uncharacterized membrane protein YphA (DoxX/SURF4 family)
VSIALWVVSILLAVAFLAAGGSKLTQPKEKLASRGMGYVEDFSQTQIRLIGTAEVLAAIALIVPQAFDVWTWLTPVAAVGLALLMVGAAVTHIRRKEPQVLGANTILFALAAFVAIGRIAT